MASPLRILVVDDDDVDAELIQRTLLKSGVDYELSFASDGVVALEMLRGSADVDPLPRPVIILLDLNMPRMNGIEFLAELRRDQKLRRTVVFVVTTSGDERDRTAAYDQNIAGYMTKSTLGDRAFDLSRLLEYYHSLVDLPL